jgi:hypothetical protein
MTHVHTEVFDCHPWLAPQQIGPQSSGVYTCIYADMCTHQKHTLCAVGHSASKHTKRQYSRHIACRYHKFWYHMYSCYNYGIVRIVSPCCQSSQCRARSAISAGPISSISSVIIATIIGNKTLSVVERARAAWIERLVDQGALVERMS